VTKVVLDNGFGTLQAKEVDMTMTPLVVYEGRRSKEEEKKER